MHPKSQDVLKVIKNFQRLPFFSKTRFLLDMGETIIHSSCNTPHCHAGWYIHAKAIEEGAPITRKVSYANGVVAIGRDLGFSEPSHLLRWACCNPDIWGNPHGELMFSSNLAFRSTKHLKSARSINGIIRHWKGVYNRLLALEKAEEEKNKKTEVPVYQDITKELAIISENVEVDVKVKELQ